MVNQYLAQNVTNPFLGNAGQTGGATFFGRFIPNLFNLVFIVGLVIFVFVFIYGAIQWITSGGDANQVAVARGKVISAVVGLILLLSLFAILNLVECFFGVGIRHYQIGPLNLTPVGQAVCVGGGSGSSGGSGGYTGNSNCPCSAALGGGCASTGQIAVGPGSACYQCTSSGWIPSGGSCSPITCGTCP